MKVADLDMNIGAALAGQLDRLLSTAVDVERLALIEAGEDDSTLWSQVAELGAQYAMASGDMGAQLSWQECLPLLHVLGWHGAPLPLAESMLANRLLSAAGLEVAQGPLALCTAAFQLSEEGCLYGDEALVPWLPVTEAMVGIAERGSEQLVFALDTGSLAFESIETLARIPSARVQLAGVQPTVCAAIGPEAGMLKPQVALVRAAQISGVFNRILDLTIDYANTRSQFGRPIGQFQAIQHLVADLALQAATAQAASNYGCRTWDEGHALQGAAVAKQLASTAAGEGARIAHQVFGAIGVTEEHELHHLTRRLWQWRQEGGSEFEWSEVLGRALIDAGGNRFWPALVGEFHVCE